MDRLIESGGFDSIALQWSNSILLLLMFALITRHASGTKAEQSWLRARVWMLGSISIILLWFYVVPVMLPTFFSSVRAAQWIALAAYLFSKCMFWSHVRAGVQVLGTGGSQCSRVAA